MKTEFSRQELYALGLPFGDGATRMKPGGRGRIYGGGGSGGVKYDNLEKLYEMQANQGQKLMDMSDKYVYPAFGSMMDDAKGAGSIANQELAAGQAAADMESSIGGAKESLASDLASMGVNPSDPRYANTMADMQLQGAAAGAAAQTGARDHTRQLGYAKMKDAVSMGMGLPSDATSALNSAGGMASSAANIQSQGAATRSANMGNIAALGARMMFADGGEVKAPQRLAVGGMTRKQCLADGGPVSKPQQFGFGGSVAPRGGFMSPIQTSAPPASAPTQSRTSMVGNAAIGLGGVKGGALVEGAGNLVGSPTISAFGQGMRLGKDASGAIDAYNGAAQTANAAGQAAASNIGTATADAAAQYGVQAGGEQAAMLASQEMGMGTLATEAAAATTGEVAGGVASAMGAGSAVAAALPWVGGAMLIGSALGLFADGGAVNKKRLAVANGIKGGPVSGPGGPKDDLVPAMLSDGEFVMPVGTVKLYGKDALEKMRQDGLAHEKQIGIGA